jgi:hypothetical protein
MSSMISFYITVTSFNITHKGIISLFSISITIPQFSTIVSDNVGKYQCLLTFKTVSEQYHLSIVTSIISVCYSPDCHCLSCTQWYRYLYWLSNEPYDENKSPEYVHSWFKHFYSISHWEKETFRREYVVKSGMKEMDLFGGKANDFCVQCLEKACL